MGWGRVGSAKEAGKAFKEGERERNDADDASRNQGSPHHLCDHLIFWGSYGGVGGVG